MKLKKQTTGCRFCTDDDFAFRHVREDEILMEIATLANELVKEYHTIASVGLRGKLDRINLMLQQFKELDNEVEQVKRARKALEVIEQDLSTS